MSIFHRISNLFSRAEVDREIDDELRSHIEMRVEDNIAAGMSPEEARRDAQLRFGNPAAMRERTVEKDAALRLDNIWRDIRYALRQMCRTPGYAVTSVVILSLGIGASTAIFSAVNPILFESLPYPQASRIMMIQEMSSDGSPMDVTFGTFHGLQERSRSLDAMEVMKPWLPTMAGMEQPERFNGQRVSASYFRTLGVSPRLGRDFQESEDRLRGPNVIILSDGLWRRRFGGDISIVGKQVRLDDNLYTVIGVMPRSFENVLAPEAALWTPLQYDASLPWDGREWGHHLRMIGRLRSGLSIEQAQSEMDGILHTLARVYAKGYDDSSGGAPDGMIVDSLQSDLTKGVRPALLAVLGAVILVLLIACVNVTNLLLARGAQRRPEFAMRAALGAQQGRLVRQLLTESLLLAIPGGALGMAIAAAGVWALAALSPPGLPRANAIAIDGAAFLFALGVTTLVGIAVGLAPALQTFHVDLHEGMRQSSQRATGGHQRTRRVLIVAEVALAVVLLVSAGLLLRSIQRLFAVDPGFDASHLLTMQVQESGDKFDSDTARLRFFTQALEAVRHVPGVVSAGFTAQLPLSGDYDVYGMQVESDNNLKGDGALRYAVTPGYIETMRIPLRHGRLLNEHDIAGASVAVLVNESLARHRFAGHDSVGQRVRLGPDAGHADRPWATIVGVVGDVKQGSLSLGDEDAFYVTTAQWAWTDDAQSLVVRTRGDAAALTAAIRNAIWSVDKDQPIVRVAAMSNLLYTSEAERHFVLLLFEVFALAGLVLAATGIYGVLSGSVTERTREIGVRAALGASRGRILALVIRQGMSLVGLGAVIGLGGAALASQALVSLLFGISRLDPVTCLV